MFELAAPSPQFIHDLKERCRTFVEVQRACGVPINVAHRLWDGKPVHKEILDMAQQHLYGKYDKPMLRLQMDALKGMGKSHLQRLTNVLHAAAEIVDKYGSILTLKVDEPKYWVFPPRDTLLRLATAVADCRKVLAQLHSECPEYDYVFRNLPDLRKKLFPELNPPKRIGRPPKRRRKKRPSSEPNQAPAGTI